MLENIKKSYQANNTQFIITNNEGVVIDSDNTLFTIEINSFLSNIHPFFENFVDIIGQDNLNFSCVHLKTNNTEVICDISTSFLSEDKYLIIITDFSKHYQSFQSLAQSRNETAIEKEVLAINNQVLKEKENFKNKFIANFSHEIKSPITSIIAFSELLNKSKLKDEQREYLDVIRSSSQHLKSIINDILDISKIETGKLTILIERFNFKNLINQVIAEYSVKCSDKKLEFVYEIDSNLPEYIESDKTRIRQIIKNLLDNALKFTKEGSISLYIKALYKRAGKLTFSIEIKDTGIGIEESEQERIFNRFNRVESLKNVEGVGLGLAIVREMVNLLNGNLTLKSKPNLGSSFTLEFKAKYPLVELDTEKKKKISKAKTLKKNQTKHRLLLVDDNNDHQLSIFKILAQSNQYFLDIVNNGFEAIESLKKNHYDLILMDFKMPLLNGLDTTKAIKNLSDKRKSSIPVILVTGNLIDSNLLQQKDVLFLDIIEKPFEEETLLNAIERAVK
ncbi:ATP-binding response regulator [Pseudofulvibacter geojedonensis]|uniref:histidine kinase n=1 Tax=Pseudofulvibacter geojedonensis TaxID=1123758 RepID=A0ABW3I1I3_9FLAO